MNWFLLFLFRIEMILFFSGMQRSFSFQNWNDSFLFRNGLILYFQEWIDPFLRWNSSEFGGIELLLVNPKYIWTPDIILYNSANANFKAYYQTNLMVYNTGIINWIPPAIVESSCKIDIRWFPFDEQKCPLKFGSWTHSKFSLNLTSGIVDKSEFTLNGEWELLGK